MHELITLIAIILLVLLFNQIYFSIYKEKVVFFKYFKGITIYSTTIIIFFIFLLNFNFIGKIDNNFLQSSIITYIFIFLVMFFNISTKSYESPTVIIYNIIKFLQ